MISDFLISQIAVGGAVICNLLSFQFKKREAVISFLTVSTALVALQLYFLGEMTAVLLTLYAIVYFLVSLKTTERRYFWLFLLGGLVIFFYTYSSWLDYFVMLSTFITLISLFNNSQKRMRQYQMVGSLVRIAYYILVFSPVGILLEVTLLVSNLTSYFRYYFRRLA